VLEWALVSNIWTLVGDKIRTTYNSAIDVDALVSEQPVDEEPEIAELSEVYQMLRRDAKDMLYDLLDGVTLWRSTARILFRIAIGAFILGALFLAIIHQFPNSG
jgi:hypothetical protein